MEMELTELSRKMLVETGKTLKGVERRLFMARTVRSFGIGGQRMAERELGWSRVTVRKAMHELKSGIQCKDAYCLRGRKRSEEHLPRLLDDIRDLADGQSQTDPTFRSQRLYVRWTAARVRALLISRKGHDDKNLPCVRTIARKLNMLGYRLRRVAKCKPKKRYAKPTRSSDIWP
jgi:hypothetical protein